MPVPLPFHQSEYLPILLCFSIWALYPSEAPGATSYSLLTHLFFSQLVDTKEQKEKGWHILQFKECLFLRDTSLVLTKVEVRLIE